MHVIFHYSLHLIKLYFYPSDFLQHNFQVIKEQPVKLEPREQNVSPYDFSGAGPYRDTAQATPSPQPPQALSPQIFMSYNNVGNAGILQNQLQGTRQLPPMQNNFQQPMYTPNIQSASPFNNGNQTPWNNGDPVMNQYFSNSAQTTSPMFVDFLTPPTNIVTQQFDSSMHPNNSSNMLDLDILNNLSGDLKQLSVSDLLK